MSHDRWVVAANAATSAWACGWNAFAGWLAPRPWRRIYFATSGLAAVYVVAWLWLLLDEGIDRKAWSEAVSPVAIASYIVVWSSWAMITSVRRWKDRHRDGSDTC